MIHALSNTDFTKLEDIIPTLERKHAAILSILIYCGLRVGELVRLRYKDIKCQAGRVNEIHLPASTSKSGVGRYIPIPKKASAAIQIYIDISSQDYKSLLPEHYLFPGTAGRLFMSVHGVEQLITRVSLKALSRKITPHVFRHTYATRLLKNTNTREVQILLGHKKLSSTQVYTHPNMEDLKKSIDKTFK